jgi:hypothetical protein
MPRGRRRANRRRPRASDQAMPDLQGDCGETAGGTARGGRGCVAHVGTVPEGAAPGSPGDPAGRLKSEEEGPGPPGGVTPGPVPVFAYGPGPVRCAEAGAAIASAAIIATPLKRCLISMVLRCSSRIGKGIADARYVGHEIMTGDFQRSLRPCRFGYRPGLLFRSPDEIFALLCSGAGLTFSNCPLPSTEALLKKTRAGKADEGGAARDRILGALRPGVRGACAGRERYRRRLSAYAQPSCYS